ncbi:hypothetical protein A2715_01030 [Candidatus Woesebacteria bacterium RIFCSPHIGHO2_01_FULL_39_32]|uniref:DUF5667 domain-containing protein n=2 Tax=Candidatus Woeseibacteriota TaxID=1752722 RepID=A0A0G0PR19_9BACT|nr:MAG: hypothetical protein UT61_C0008G0029 [Candidatus Woesebacteria bacterium GW2011_GWA1_39_8]OGM03666.1 MAG: hypothetical protein A2124_03155 [Candidatus Woesebacteria bacterium GWB1_37_5]OGM24490.1 MAG: hypothetical protein A2715_01030 [Candidatus Woesebacteria bacterium RIFCSPHIGHO2_01_FULL_39_32]OGM38879.1 MAG: hypothetical protein A3F01_03835 [Candidatus Woesebacteria bacterium RIFCSPHIGHO2_12_FULL_38_11]OGM63796.1 MAG: hypothetical protein A2893_02365 [Candidatus Woesebacteria bacteri
MWPKLFLAIIGLSFAIGILFVSLFRVASVKYEFDNSASVADIHVSGENGVSINYTLPYPGRVLPDSPLWPLKAIRDRVWLFITTNSTREAELKLLFADKRLGMAQILFEKGEIEKGFSTLTKAEKYLEEAVWQEKQNRENGIDTSAFLEQLAKASLKHYEVMENLIPSLPDEVRPSIRQTQDYAKRAYEESRNALLEKRRPAPENPFAW